MKRAMGRETGKATTCGITVGTGDLNDGNTLRYQVILSITLLSGRRKMSIEKLNEHRKMVRVWSDAFLDKANFRSGLMD